MSDLDFSQIIQQVYDEAENRLRVDSQLTASIIAPPGLEVAITDVDDSIKIGNGSGIFAQVTGANALKIDGSSVTQPISGSVSVSNFPLTQPVTQSGVWNINNISGTISLPTGSATSTNQLTEITALNTIHSDLTGTLNTKLTDGTDTALVTTNGEQKVVDGLRNGGAYGVITLTTTGTQYEAKVNASRLSNRKMLMIYPVSSGIFWGLDNTVTTTTGMPMTAGQLMSFNIDPDSTFQIWLVGNADNLTANIVECP